VNRRQLLVFAIVLYFTFIGGSFYTDFRLFPRVFNQLVVTAIIGIWLIKRLRRGEGFPGTPLDRPIAAWLAALFVTAVLGLSPRFSLEQLWTPFTYALAFYLLVDLVRHGQTVLVAQALYMSATVVCLVALGEIACWYFGLPLLPHFGQGWPAIGGLEHPFPPTLPYGDRLVAITLNGATPLSAYLALLIPPAVAILMTARSRESKQGIAIWLVLAAIVEALTFSRGGILALSVSLPLTGLSWWLARRETGFRPGMHWWASIRGSKRLARFPVRLLSGVLLAVGVVVVVVLGSLWIENTFAHRASSTNFRFTLWRSALTIFSEHPLTGAGPFNYGRALLRRDDADLPRRQVMTAHNLYLNTAAETGLLGLAAGGWLVATAGRAIWRRWRRSPAADERIRIGATGAALAGLAAHSLVDTFTATAIVLPALALAAYALVGPSDDSASPVSTERRREGAPVAIAPRLASTTKGFTRLAVVVALAVLLLYALGLLWLDVARFHFQRSVTLAGRGEWSDAVLAAERARDLDPSMTLYTFQLARVLGVASAEERTDVDSAMAARAVDLYRDALVAEPGDGHHTANLAALLWRQGDRQAASETMARAVAIEPTPVLFINAAYFLQQLGDLSSAEVLYARALAAAPQLAVSEFWQADEWRRGHWPQIVSRAERMLPAGEAANRWRLMVALARCDWAEVEQRAATIIADSPFDCLALSARARARLRAGQADFARQEAEMALSVNRGCGAAYLVSGQARYALGDLVAAERDWRTALFLGQPRASFHLGQLYQSRGDVGAAARFYQMDLPVTTTPTDVTATLYGWPVAFDLLPPLFRIGVGSEEAAAGLALAALHEAEGDWTSARLVYQALLAEDPYLEEAAKQLEATDSMQ
jgi:O-antigen ligase/tetratricopeptide (TPR) repeat protein